MPLIVSSSVSGLRPPQNILAFLFSALLGSIFLPSENYSHSNDLPLHFLTLQLQKLDFSPNLLSSDYYRIIIS